MAQEPKDEEGRPYHVGLSRKDVGRIAFLPGDPERVPLIAKHFTSPKEVNSHREYTTHSGTLAGERVIAMSTGIGGPSAANAIEELARLGVRVMIRVGTCGAIDRTVPVGTVIIADAAVRLDGATAQYVMKEYPAAATPELVMALKAAASQLKKKVRVGLSASTDSFYVGQGREGFGGYFPSSSANLVKDLQKAKVLCFEMESSTLFTLGRLFGLKTAAILAVVGNRVSDEFRSGAGVEDAISIATRCVSLFRRYGV